MAPAECTVRVINVGDELCGVRIPPIGAILRSLLRNITFDLYPVRLEVTSLSSENSSLRASQEDLQKENAGLKEDVQTLQEQLNESMSLNDSLAAQLRMRNEQNDRLNKQIERLKGQINGLLRS